MIEHQPQQQRFCYVVAEDQAVLTYQLNQSHIHFSSTYVPDALRGQGVAAALVTEALAWAREHHYHITSSCWYVDKFLDKAANR